MEKKRSVGLLILGLLVGGMFFSTITFAETIILKSGQKIEGKILEKTDKYIKIDFDGIPITYYSDEIERIEGDISVKQTREDLYDEEQIKSIIIDYYNIFDSKNLLRLETYFSKNILPSEEGKYFMEEARTIFSEYMYIKTKLDLNKINFEMKGGALWVSFWRFRTCISSKKGMIITLENKVILTFKKENGDWKIEKEWQFLEKDNLLLWQADDLLAKNKVDEAIEMYKEVITMNPHFSSAYLALMYAYSISNKIEEAVTSIQKAIYLRPDVAAYHYLLGMLYSYNKNESENTKKELLKAKELDPNFPRIDNVLQALE